MNWLPPPWSKESIWGLSLDALSVLSVLITETRDRDGTSAAAFFWSDRKSGYRPGPFSDATAEIERFGIFTMPKNWDGDRDLDLQITERGRALIEGLRVQQDKKLEGRGDKLAICYRRYLATWPKDPRTRDEIENSLLELKRDQLRIEDNLKNIMFEFHQLASERRTT